MPPCYDFRANLPQCTVQSLLAGMNNIEYSNIYEWTHFGRPDNNTNFMTCHVSGPKPKDWIKIWHDIFD